MPDMTSQTAKKVSAPRAECETCGKDYANQKNLKNHVDKDHKPIQDPENEANPAAPGDTFNHDNDSAVPFVQTEHELNAENEMMEEFAKQLDLLEQIKKMTQNEQQDVDENKLKKDIEEHLERFKLIVIKKNAILKETREDKLKYKHEADCSKQVESKLTSYLEAKESVIGNLKN